MVRVTSAVLVAWIAVAAAPGAAAQIPQKFENLQYFPKDMSREALTQRMREFSFALGVRCQHCHAGGDGVSFQGVVFSSDEKIAKQKARFMLRMVDTLNSSVLAGLPGGRTAGARMDCVHCHRGAATPRTLASELTAVIDAKGPQAAAERYRELRTNALEGGFDLTEWSVSELARTLVETGKLDAAVAMLEMNAEFNPKSSAVDMQLAEVYRKRGDREKAIARYRLVLEKEPKNPRALQALKELEAKPG